MAALSDEIDTLKFVHTYGAGLHSGDTDPDVHDPRWQQRQVDDFVEFAVVAEELKRMAKELRPSLDQHGRRTPLSRVPSARLLPYRTGSGSP